MSNEPDERHSLKGHGTRPSCPTCDLPMVDGFIVDHSQAATIVATWVEGQPTYSFLGNAKVDRKAQYKVKAYRCEQCGLLNLYAN